MTRRNAAITAASLGGPRSADLGLRHAIYTAEEVYSCLERVASALADLRRRRVLTGGERAGQELASLLQELVAVELSLADHQLRKLRTMLGADGPFPDLSIFIPGLAWGLADQPSQLRSLCELARQLEQSTNALLVALGDLLDALRARRRVAVADGTGWAPTLPAMS